MLYDFGPEQLEEEKEANRRAMAEFRQRLEGGLRKGRPRPWWRRWDVGPRAGKGQEGIESGSRRLSL